MGCLLLNLMTIGDKQESVFLFNANTIAAICKIVENGPATIEPK
ncbi:hypothetical protein LLB_1675 [Legionella longbeachae D-4968]|nr:hypothetical protein LLB_1675 [Legionella longbeachae D-4968]